MDSLVLFCKSYAPDLERCVQLVRSVERYNQDGIAFYLSVPREDQARFQDRLGRVGVNYLVDEDIVRAEVVQSWRIQQLLKFGFAKTGIAENYLLVDSDFVLIRNFTRDEFFAFPGVPYTICWETRSNPFQRRLIGTGDADDDQHYPKMLTEVRAGVRKIQETFGRRGPWLSFGAPAIWASRVVVALEEDAKTNRGLDLIGLLEQAPFEMNWYGEFLLASRAIPMVPRDNVAFHFISDYEYQRFLFSGFSIASLAEEGYLAVNFASRWMRVVGLDELRLPQSGE